jgi:Protein of unknown function (DUF1236)
VPFGKYCLSRPLLFSFEPRCHGLCGSQKYTRLGNEQAQQVQTGYRPQVGSTLPDAVQIRSLPPEIVRQVPDLQTFHYTLTPGYMIVVDPRNHMVMS